MQTYNILGAMNLTLMYLILLFIVDSAKAQVQSCPENNNCRSNYCNSPRGGTWTCSDGCNNGFWGGNCTFLCSDVNCQYCDRKTGLCLICNNEYYRGNDNLCRSCNYFTQRGCLCSGNAACNDCLEGYNLYNEEQWMSKYSCRACADWHFGYRCSLPCSGGCSDVCNKINGTCLCKPNYTGAKCETCIPGKYGRLCEKDCSRGCLPPCSITTGLCSCKPHFTGTLCESCLNGWYGAECNQPCGQNCDWCHTESSCISCKAGYHGLNCQDKCPSTCESCVSYSNCSTCKPGYYGSYCQSSCSAGCAKTTCDKHMGSCSPCVKGKTGHKCTSNCSEGCLDEICKQDNGECTNKCKDGYYGYTCESQCPEHCLNCVSAENCGACRTGYFGSFCQFSCSAGCAEYSCKKQDGICTPCVKGKTGQYCISNCSEGCVNDICYQYGGRCKDGCIEGYFGLKCDNKCPSNCRNCSSAQQCETCASGYYGSTCERRCPDTCQTCNDKGECLTCKVNYFDPHKQCHCLQSVCKSLPCEACLNSSYYPNEDSSTCCPCSSQCKHSLCSSAALCTHGCENGYFGAGCGNVCTIRDKMCTICNEHTLNTFVCTSCIERYYPNTNGTCISCSANCLESICNSSTGYCEKGCKHGFWNSKCEITCQPNCSVCDQDSGQCLICSIPSFHGSNCEKPCNRKCTNESCHMNGHCTSGCISNYFGPSCDTPCSSNCAQNESESLCSPETGLCTFGCSEGFTGDTCMEALKQGSTIDSVPAAAIGGGVAALVIVAMVIVIGAVLFMRRKNRQPNTAIVHETSYDADNSVAPVYASVVRAHNTDAVYANTSPVKENTTSGHVTNPVFTNNLSDQHLAIQNITFDDGLEVDELDNIARQNAIRFEENGGVYYNNDSEVKKFNIPVAELQKFVMSKNKDYFRTEFEKLPYGLLKDYNVSQRKANIAKNRYKGIYPYDDHRVKILGGDTDYINASFIDGFNRRNEYIATLGPMSKQLGDFSAFWRMVWQQQVEKIVMVTNLMEGGIEKCEQYWPNEGSSRMFGDVRVLCPIEDHHSGSTRRTFTIKKDKEERTVNHLHFTSWPDKDVPDDVKSIIEFRQKVLLSPSTLGGPTIVHCSAGIGRTGTYIAIDILINEGKSQGTVDIAGCVLNMRQNRPNMVQTAGQYEYLHHAVVHALTFDRKPE